MGEKTKKFCPSCGDLIDSKDETGTAGPFCRRCESRDSHANTVKINSDQGTSTVVLDSADPQNQEKTIVNKGRSTKNKADSDFQSTTIASAPASPKSQEETIVNLRKYISATKKIKELLNIETEVDLEKSSSLYFSKKGKPGKYDIKDLTDNLIAIADKDTKYIVDKTIGLGGMGAILETLDQDVRRKVAMKVLLDDHKENISAIKRFLEEAQITGQLEHPNVVPIYEIGIDDDSRAYFTMKLVKGDTLESVIDKIVDDENGFREEYSLGIMLQVFMKVCDGIGYAHSKGVLHRDLKPENIMLGDFGEVLVMDWGISKILGKEEIYSKDPDSSILEKEDDFRTVEGSIMGTPSYMPPEQASGEVSGFDERLDIFALGAILYKILTYHAPYEEGTIQDKLYQAQIGDIVPPNIRAPKNNIPAELSAVCMKAMAPDKEDRYPSVADLKNDIQLYLDGKSVSAKKDNFITRSRKWIKRNKAASIGIAAALICLIAGIIFSTILQEKKRQNTIADLLINADTAGFDGRYEEAEETYFAVLGLDTNNIKAREGISRVSGDALSMKNRRLAKEKIIEADQLFKDGNYMAAYDSYVATFALDPSSDLAREGIQKSAVLADRQKAQIKIKPIFGEADKLLERKKVIENDLTRLSSKIDDLQGKITGYENFESKKPLWDTQKIYQVKKIENLKIEGEIISKYSKILGLDGTNSEARRALAGLYYQKYRDAEEIKNREDMAYHKELLLAFDDGYYKDLLEKNGIITLATTPNADEYFLFRYLEGPDRRLIPVPVRSNEIENNPTVLIDPDFDISKTAFSRIGDIISRNNNRFKDINNLELPAGSYLIVIKKKGFIDTRVPVLIERNKTTVLKNIKLISKNSIPEGFVYIPEGEFIFGGDADAPNSAERD
ncbi:serine/threonine-protein kinase, partial [Thermodesulfobacteriota bacterium]